MTIVKVQRPIITNDPNRCWLVYDKFDARRQEIPERDMPKGVTMVMDARPRRAQQFKSFFKDAEWDNTTKTWDLSKAVLTGDKEW